MILWIEDDLSSIEHHIEELRYAGYNVQVVENPDKLLVQIAADPRGIDLVIVDIMLPRSSLIDDPQKCVRVPALDHANSEILDGEKL